MDFDPASGVPLGILGGTFDPFHTGHLRLAIEAREALRLDHVRFVPLNKPNHRGPPLATPPQRIAMLRAGLDGAGLVVDDREMRRGGVSYSVDTLASLRADFPHSALCFLLGHDAVAGLAQWHRWTALCDFCHLVVVSRGRAQATYTDAVQKFIDSRLTADPDILRTELCGHIYFLTIPLLPIASTDIRERLAAGRDVTGLVPGGVLQEIKDHGLYVSNARGDERIGA